MVLGIGGTALGALALGIPFVVAINCFDGVLAHRVEDVREAMSIDDTIPIVSCDARNRESTKQTLIALVEHAMRLREARAGAATVTRGSNRFPSSTASPARRHR